MSTSPVAVTTPHYAESLGDIGLRNGTSGRLNRTLPESQNVVGLSVSVLYACEQPKRAIRWLADLPRYRPVWFEVLGLYGWQHNKIGEVPTYFRVDCVTPYQPMVLNNRRELGHVYRVLRDSLRLSLGVPIRASSDLIDCVVLR